MPSSETPRVLSIQSHVVSGYVGNKCAVFPLQVLGFEVDFINSVQFSNHTGYGLVKGQILNEKDLDDVYSGLKSNSLGNYNKILTGYVGAESFLRKICEVVKDIKSRNPETIYLCDPVLGDDGHLYVPESLAKIYADEVLPLADIVTPNTFEMQLLTGMTIVTEDDVLEATSRLHGKGIKIVILSSLDSPSPEIATYVSYKPGQDCERRVWKVLAPRIPSHFTGTGDLFSALFLGWYTKLNKNIPKVLTTTLSTMGKILQRTHTYGLAHPRVSKANTELQLIQSLQDIISPPSTVGAIEIEIKQKK